MNAHLSVNRCAGLSVFTMHCVFVHVSVSPTLSHPGALTRTLCRPVRLGDSQTSWVSDTVNMQGFSPISTV